MSLKVLITSGISSVSLIILLKKVAKIIFMPVLIMSKINSVALNTKLQLHLVGAATGGKLKLAHFLLMLDLVLNTM
jgi:hypothetical protein